MIIPRCCSQTLCPKLIKEQVREMRPETPVIRITVERVFHPQEISPRPLTSAIKDQCSIFKEGETYQYTGFQQPQGFCPIAWQTIYPYAFTLYKGGDISSWYGDPDVAILCCPDGRRPVISGSNESILILKSRVFYCY